MASKYLVWGGALGALAPAGFLAYTLVGRRACGPLQVFGAMAAGGLFTFGIAGWMIGRRDDALVARNRSLRKLSDRLRALAVTDALTGIQNRRSLDERLLEETARANRYRTPMTVVMGDLDHFKDLNDRCGHRSGDDVLRQIASALDQEKRLGDLVARYGGDEFVAVLPHTDGAAARVWAERVRQNVERMLIPTCGREGAVTISLGIAEAETPDETPARLLERADEALYDAKSAGRNRVAVSRSSADGRKRAF